MICPLAMMHGDGIRLLPERASTMARQVDYLFLALTLMSAFFVVLISGLILIFIVRYRRRDPLQVGVAIGKHNWIEYTWTIVPLCIAMVFFIWSARLYIRMASPPPNALEIHVLGKQWMWKIQQPNGKKEINELHVPVGRPVRLIMTSQDVIHAFFIPAFRIKQDVLPGRYSTEWFTATKVGEYHLFCSEYCGTSHSQMIGKVVVMTPGDYAAWLADTPANLAPHVAGYELFRQYHCVDCHGQRAPSLAGLYGRRVLLSDGTSVVANDDYLRESILNPRAKLVAGFPPIMPSFAGQLNEEQIFDLIAYIKWLADTREQQAPAESLPPATTRAATRPSQTPGSKLENPGTAP